MANFCGGIRLGKTLKVINGIITTQGVSTTNKNNAISTCGQLWDKGAFGVKSVNGAKYITLLNADENVVPFHGNCGVGLDGRFFKKINGNIEYQDGFMLTVNTTPKEANIVVKMNDESEPLSPVSGTTNQFIIPLGLSEDWIVTVSKEGYTAKTQTVKIVGDTTVDIVLSTAT